MKLRAQITIDMEADDYVAAAEFQRQMQGLMVDVRTRYEQADLDLRERRAGPVRRRPGEGRQRTATGALHLYEER